MRSIDPLVRRQFQDGTSVSACQSRLFHGDYKSASAEGTQGRLLIQRFDEAGIHDTDLESLFLSVTKGDLQ